MIGLVAGVRQKAVDVVQNQTTRADAAYCVTCPDGQKIRVERPCKADAAWWGLMAATLAPHGLADLTTFGLYTAAGPLAAPLLTAVPLAPFVTLAALGAAGAGAVGKITSDMDKKCADLKFYFEGRENFLAIDMVLSSHLNQTDKAKLQEACLDREEAREWQDSGFPLAQENQKLKLCMTHESLCGVSDGRSPVFSKVDDTRGQKCPAKDDTIRVDKKDILKAGSLMKLSKGLGAFKKGKWASRYIVLTRTHLYSFKDEEDLKKPSDLIVRVADISEVQDADTETDEQTDENNKFQVVTAGRVFVLAAETPEIKEEWIKFLSQRVLQGSASE